MGSSVRAISKGLNFLLGFYIFQNIFLDKPTDISFRLLGTSEKYGGSIMPILRDKYTRNIPIV